MSSHPFHTIHLKVRVPGIAWADLPSVEVDLNAIRNTLIAQAEAVGTVRCAIPDKDLACAVACGLAQAAGEEVRWNWATSHQGNYVAPTS